MVSLVTAKTLSKPVIIGLKPGVGASAQSVMRQVRPDTWLPFTERLVIKPDWTYLAKSALLARVLLGYARSWLNQPAKIDDPKLSPPQKKQAFLESCFKEVFGTPANMILMHLGSDGTGALLQKLKFVRKRIHVPASAQIPTDQLEKANQLLSGILGKKGWAANAVFNPKAGLTHFRELLDSNALGHLWQNPTFRQAVVHNFTRLKLAGSLCFVAQMLVNIGFGGFFIQQFNDTVWAPCLEKQLYKTKPLKETV